MMRKIFRDQLMRINRILLRLSALFICSCASCPLQARGIAAGNTKLCLKESPMAADIFQKRYGDCKDKTTLLIAMLKTAGIEALSALVLYHPEHFDETMPSLKVSNHVIAAVPESAGYFCLGATRETTSFDSAPFLRPTKFFLIFPDGSYKFIQTPPPGYAYKYLPPEQRIKHLERKGITATCLQLGSFAGTRRPFTIELQRRLESLAQKLDNDLMVLSDIIGLYVEQKPLGHAVGMESFDTFEESAQLLPEHQSAAKNIILEKNNVILTGEQRRC